MEQVEKYIYGCVWYDERRILGLQDRKETWSTEVGCKEFFGVAGEGEAANTLLIVPSHTLRNHLWLLSALCCKPVDYIYILHLHTQSSVAYRQHCDSEKGFSKRECFPFLNRDTEPCLSSVSTCLETDPNFTCLFMCMECSFCSCSICWGFLFYVGEPNPSTS